LSTQLQQYEGSALEPLLERIHKEHGPRVKILRAERVREGGVLGFFAKEMFRLTVDAKVAPKPQERQRYDATRKPTRSGQDASSRSGKPASQPGVRQPGVRQPGVRQPASPPARQEQVAAQRSPAVGSLTRQQSSSRRLQSPPLEGSSTAPRQPSLPDSDAQGQPASSILADTLSMDDALDISTPPIHSSAASAPTATAQPAGTTAIQPGFAEVLARVAHDMDMDASPGLQEGVPVGKDTDASSDGDFTEEIVFEDIDGAYVLGDSTGWAELESGPSWLGSGSELGQEVSNGMGPEVLDGVNGASTANQHIAPSRPFLPTMLMRAGIPEQLLDSHEVAELNDTYDPAGIAKTLVDTFARLPTAPPPPARPLAPEAAVSSLPRIGQI